MSRIDDVFDYEVAGNLGTDQLPEKARLNGNIEIKNLTFGYSSLSEPLIEDFNLSLSPGDRVALVRWLGFSEKSTISKVVPVFMNVGR